MLLNNLSNLKVTTFNQLSGSYMKDSSKPQIKPDPLTMYKYPR